MNLICIKPIEELGISIIADENTLYLYYVPRIYDEGTDVDSHEEFYEMKREIYEYYKHIITGENNGKI